ncbi:Uncharacterized protein SCF082_LOCUS38778 [Durusdinium trenchii]|uniref:Uncharacterized protein n=1 Tax=Durusdinium trenchii TaxID=1381693 RepID=A0ABP0Q195_9DINO
MFVFLNAAENKCALRQMGFTFHSGDATVDIACKLRDAFLCERFAGRWKVGGISDANILQAMKSQRCLPQDAVNLSKEDMFEAMKTFARVHRLQEKRTYNGLALNILQHINRTDPKRRSNVTI